MHNLVIATYGADLTVEYNLPSYKGYLVKSDKYNYSLVALTLTEAYRLIEHLYNALSAGTNKELVDKHNRLVKRKIIKNIGHYAIAVEEVKNKVTITYLKETDEFLLTLKEVSDIYIWKERKESNYDKFNTLGSGSNTIMAKIKATIRSINNSPVVEVEINGAKHCLETIDELRYTLPKWDEICSLPEFQTLISKLGILLDSSVEDNIGTYAVKVTDNTLGFLIEPLAQGNRHSALSVVMGDYLITKISSPTTYILRNIEFVSDEEGFNGIPLYDYTRNNYLVSLFTEKDWSALQKVHAAPLVSLGDLVEILKKESGCGEVHTANDHSIVLKSGETIMPYTIIPVAITGDVLDHGHQLYRFKDVKQIVIVQHVPVIPPPPRPMNGDYTCHFNAYKHTFNSIIAV